MYIGKKERKTLKDCCEERLESIYSLAVQPSGVTTKEWDSATAKLALTCQYSVWLCWQAPVQDPLGSVCQETGKEYLLQEYFRHALLK